MAKVVGSVDVTGTVAGGFSRLKHPRTVATLTTDQINVPNGSQTEVNWDDEDLDTDNWHDTVTNNSRITVDRSGLFLLECTATFEAHSTGDRGALFRINASTVIAPAMHQRSVTSSDESSIQISAIQSLSSGDFVEVRVRQTSGGTLDLRATGSEFAVTFLGVSAS